MISLDLKKNLCCVFLIFLQCMCMHAQLLQSCPTLCDPRNCSPPCSSVHGILQARIPELVAISFSRGFSRPRDQTQVPALQADSLMSELSGKPQRRRGKNKKYIPRSKASSLAKMYRLACVRKDMLA